MKWNQKWTALALAGVMSLSLLAACTQTGGELTPPTTTAPATRGALRHPRARRDGGARREP